MKLNFIKQIFFSFVVLLSSLSTLQAMQNIINNSDKIVKGVETAVNAIPVVGALYKAHEAYTSNMVRVQDERAQKESPENANTVAESENHQNVVVYDKSYSAEIITTNDKSFTQSFNPLLKGNLVPSTIDFTISPEENKNSGLNNLYSSIENYQNTMQSDRGRSQYITNMRLNETFQNIRDLDARYTDHLIRLQKESQKKLDLSSIQGQLLDDFIENQKKTNQHFSSPALDLIKESSRNGTLFSHQTIRNVFQANERDSYKKNKPAFVKIVEKGLRSLGSWTPGKRQQRERRARERELNTQAQNQQVATVPEIEIIDSPAGTSDRGGDQPRVMSYEQIKEMIRFMENDQSNTEQQSAPSEPHVTSGGSSGPNLPPDPENDKTEKKDKEFRTSCKYKDTTNRGSKHTNIETDVTKKELEETLLNDGWIKTSRNDGKGDNYIKGEERFFLRNQSKSVEGPTADYYRPGSKEADIKIRLAKELTVVAAISSTASTDVSAKPISSSKATHEDASVQDIPDNLPAKKIEPVAQTPAASIPQAVAQAPQQKASTSSTKTLPITVPVSAGSNKNKITSPTQKTVTDILKGASAVESVGLEGKSYAKFGGAAQAHADFGAITTSSTQKGRFLHGQTHNGETATYRKYNQKTALVEFKDKEAGKPIRIYYNNGPLQKAPEEKSGTTHVPTTLPAKAIEPVVQKPATSIPQSVKQGHNQQSAIPEPSVTNGGGSSGLNLPATPGLSANKPSITGVPTSGLKGAIHSAYTSLENYKSLKNVVQAANNQGISNTAILNALSPQAQTSFNNFVNFDRNMQMAQAGLIIAQHPQEVIDTAVQAVQTIVYFGQVGVEAVKNTGNALDYFFYDDDVPCAIEERMLLFNENDAAEIQDAPLNIQRYHEAISWKLLNQTKANFTLKGNAPNEDRKYYCVASKKSIALLQGNAEYNQHIQKFIQDYNHNQQHNLKVYEGIPTTEEFLYERCLNNAHELEQLQIQRKKLAGESKAAFDKKNFGQAKNKLQEAVDVYNQEKTLWTWLMASNNSIHDAKKTLQEDYEVILPIRSDNPSVYPDQPLTIKRQSARHTLLSRLSESGPKMYAFESVQNLGFDSAAFLKFTGTPANQLIHEELLPLAVATNDIVRKHVSESYDINKNLIVKDGIPLVGNILEKSREHNHNNRIPQARALAELGNRLSLALEAAAAIHAKHAPQTSDALNSGMNGLYSWFTWKKDDVNYAEHFSTRWSESFSQASAEERKVLINKLNEAIKEVKNAVYTTHGNKRAALDEKLLGAANIVAQLKQGQAQGSIAAAQWLSNLLDLKTKPETINQLITNEHRYASKITVKNKALSTPISNVFGHALRGLYQDALKRKTPIQKPETTVPQVSVKNESNKSVSTSVPVASPVPQAKVSAAPPPTVPQAVPVQQEQPLPPIASTTPQLNPSTPPINAPPHRGITSGVNGCYFNATTQCLANSLPSTFHSDDPYLKGLVSLKQKLDTNNATPVNVTNFRNAVINKMPNEFVAGAQADAPALMNFFLEHISESKCTLFNTHLESVISRPGCGHQSITRDDPELFLTPEIPENKEKTTLQESLRTYFGVEHGIKSRCDICNHETDNATKQLTIASLPEKLVLQLKRFNNDGEKIDTPVSFPTQHLTFNLTKPQEAIPATFDYTLTGFVQHEGTMDGGHYVSYINKHGQWYHCNDGTTTPVSNEVVEKIAQDGVDENFTPYILMYDRIGNASSSISAHNVDNSTAPHHMHGEEDHAHDFDLISTPLQTYASLANNQTQFNHEAAFDMLERCDKGNAQHSFEPMIIADTPVIQLSTLCQSYPVLELMPDYGKDHDRLCGYYAVHNAEIFANYPHASAHDFSKLLNNRDAFEGTLQECVPLIKVQRNSSDTINLFGAEIESLIPRKVANDVIVVGAYDEMDDQEEKQLRDAQKIHTFCSGQQDHLVWVVPSNNNDHWLTLLTRKNNENQLETFVADSLGYDRSNDPQTPHQIKNIIQLLADEQGKLAKHQKISISQSSAAVAGTFDPNSPPDSEEDEEEDKGKEELENYKGKKISKPLKKTYANNVNAQKNLSSKLSELEKAQARADKVRNLPDGRIRYYEKERPAKSIGATRGNARVTEFDPKTGDVRSWEESYNHQGEVTRIHPKTLNGQLLQGQHYPPTGKELQFL